MSSKQTSESDPTVASRFLAHQLSDGERVMLEAELMVNPAAVQELEATARLKVGLQRLRESGELDALLAPPARRNRVPVMLLLAASVAAVALLLGRMVIAPAPPLLMTLEQRPEAASATSYLVALRRRATEANTTDIDTPRAGEAIKLNILPTQDLPPPFRVELQQADNGTLGQLTVAASNSRYVSVLLDAAQLQPGTYLLILTSLGSSVQSQERFLLRIRAAGAPAPSSQQ